MGVTYGVEEQVLPETDDGTEGPIAIDPGLPFGNFTQYTFYVSLICLFFIKKHFQNVSRSVQMDFYRLEAPTTAFQTSNSLEL